MPPSRLPLIPRLLLLLWGLVASTACGGDESALRADGAGGGEAPASEARAEPETPDGLPATAGALLDAFGTGVGAEDGFEPPADGRLTGRQLDLYLAVLRQAVKDSRRRDVGGVAEETREAIPLPPEGEPLSGSFDALGPAGPDHRAARLEAARALGYDLAEYRWVERRVHDTLAAGVRDRGNREIDDARELWREFAAADRPGGTRTAVSARDTDRVTEAGDAPAPEVEAEDPNARLVAERRAEILSLLPPAERTLYERFEAPEAEAREPVR